MAGRICVVETAAHEIAGWRGTKRGLPHERWLEADPADAGGAGGCASKMDQEVRGAGTMGRGTGDHLAVGGSPPERVPPWVAGCRLRPAARSFRAPAGAGQRRRAAAKKPAGWPTACAGWRRAGAVDERAQQGGRLLARWLRPGLARRRPARVAGIGGQVGVLAGGTNATTRPIRRPARPPKTGQGPQLKMASQWRAGRGARAGSGCPSAAPSALAGLA